MKNSIVILKGKGKNISVGNNLPLRVSVPIGINNIESIKSKIELLESLLTNNFTPPDLFADLSLIAPKKRFYEYIIERFDGPVGFLPHYLADNEKQLLKEIELSIKKGISHITIHYTANSKLFELAKKNRQVITTSRGGIIIINELMNSQKSYNLYERTFKNIVSLIKGTNVVISLGSTFRPSGIDESMDIVHREETKMQIRIAEEFRSYGISTMIEGLGHSNISNIRNYYKLLGELGNASPLMTLGPLANDSSFEYDPIAAVVGGTSLSSYENFSITQVITKDEHNGGIPSDKSTIEGYKIAKSMANCINSDRGYNNKDLNLSFHRRTFQTCKLETELIRKKVESVNCTRCLEHCPLRALNKTNNPLIEHLQQYLPKPIDEVATNLVYELESLNIGTIILFGSTAKKLFSYSQNNGKLFLQSDLEFNIITSKKIPENIINSLYDVVRKYLKVIGLDQPLFDLDIRIRTSDSLKNLPNDIQIKKSLYCYGVRTENNYWNNSSSETDILNIKGSYSSYFRSTIEWLVLKLVHIDYLPHDDKAYWISSIKCSLICKLIPNYLIQFGLPYTGTSLDIKNLDKISNSSFGSKNLSEYISLLKNCWSARQDSSGSEISKIEISHNTITQLISNIFSYYKKNRLIEYGIINDFTMTLVRIIDDPKFWTNPNKNQLQEVKEAFSLLLSNYRKNNINFQIKYNYHLNNKI